MKKLRRLWRDLQTFAAKLKPFNININETEKIFRIFYIYRNFFDYATENYYPVTAAFLRSEV